MKVAINGLNGNILVDKSGRGWLEIPCIHSHSLNRDNCTYNCPLCDEVEFEKGDILSACEFTLKSSEPIKEVIL